MGGVEKVKVKWEKKLDELLDEENNRKGSFGNKMSHVWCPNKLTKLRRCVNWVHFKKYTPIHFVSVTTDLLGEGARNAYASKKKRLFCTNQDTFSKGIVVFELLLYSLVSKKYQPLRITKCTLGRIGSGNLFFMWWHFSKLPLKISSEVSHIVKIEVIL